MDRRNSSLRWCRVAPLLAALWALPLLLYAGEKDVIFEPTPMPVVRAMLDLAKVGPKDVVFDLGSGDGRFVITAAKEYGAEGVGIEIDSKLVEEARANARKAGVEDRARFIPGNMYEADISSATVVTLFLHPEPNMKLRPKLLSELKPGSRVVSYIWDMGDWKPDAVRTVDNRRKIYLWRVPERKKEMTLGTK
jgi:SAM-dependent methyltransferase